MEENKTSHVKKWIDENIINPGDEFSPGFEEFRRRVNITSFVMFFLFTLMGIGLYVGFSLLHPEYWSTLWVLTLSGIIIGSLTKSLLMGRMSQFVYPILVVCIFCSVGGIYQIYHPLWVIFLFIPAYYGIAGSIEKAMAAKEEASKTMDSTK